MFYAFHVDFMADNVDSCGAFCDSSLHMRLKLNGFHYLWINYFIIINSPAGSVRMMSFSLTTVIGLVMTVLSEGVESSVTD